MMVAIACQDNDNRVAVDKAYLESPDYQSFREQSNQLWDSGTASIRMVERVVSQHSDEKGKALKIPATINTDDIFLLLENSSELVVEANAGTHTYYAIGSVASGAYLLRLLLQCERASYTDCTVWAITASGGTIEDARPIAHYQKSISQTVESAIRITGSRRLMIETLRMIHYPIEQQNSMIYRYRISKAGDIVSGNN